MSFGQRGLSSAPAGDAHSPSATRTRKATQRSYNFSQEIIGNASIYQVMNYEISSFIELTSTEVVGRESGF